VSDDHRVSFEYESRPIAKVRATCSCRRWNTDWVRQKWERLLTIKFVDHARKITMKTKSHMPKFEDRMTTIEGASVEQQCLVCTCGGWRSVWADMTPLGLSAITASWRSHVTKDERGR